MITVISNDLFSFSFSLLTYSNSETEFNLLIYLPLIIIRITRKYFTNCTKVVTNYRDTYFINAKETTVSRNQHIYIYIHIQ